MNLTMFYELDDSGSPVIDEHLQPAIRHRPESKALADVLLVARSHAANPAMHHVIDKFIELHAVTLQWDWFEQYQAWLDRKAYAEVLPEIDLGVPIEPFIFELFTEPAPVRPEFLTVAQSRSWLLIDGLSIDEYLFRTVRANAVRSITVDVDGLVFDGDEDSQRRMLAAIHASEDAGITQTIWRLADNSQIAVNLEQLRAAHAAAIIEQGKLWTKTES
jgi:hypothetical protein